MSNYKVFITNVLNPINDRKAQYLPNHAIICHHGKIREILNFKTFKEHYANTSSMEIISKTDSLCIPGFFDMHFHWVQDDVSAMPKAFSYRWLFSKQDIDA